MSTLKERLKAFRRRLPSRQSVGGGILTTAKVVFPIAEHIDVPIVSTVIGIASEIVKIVDEAQHNRDACSEVGDKVAFIILAIQDLDTGGIVEFQEELRGFEGILAGIKRDLVKLQEEGLLMHLLHKEKYASQIQSMKNDLDNQLFVFQTKGLFNHRVRTAQQLDEMLYMLRTSSQNQMLQIQHNSFLSILPAVPVHYQGIQVDQIVLDILKDSLTGHPARINITGAGGMGKTSLALAVLHDSRIVSYFGTNRYFLPCENILSAMQMGEDLVAMFGLSELGKSEIGLQKNSVITVLNFLKAQSTKVLLVVDNFETCWEQLEQIADYEKILGNLNKISNLTILFTMRGLMHPNSVEWKYHTEITTLDKQAACILFQKYAELETITPEIERLVLLLHGVPLSIILMAKQMLTHMPIQFMIERWENENIGMLTEADTKQQSVECSIKISLNSKYMTIAAKHLLGILAYIPDNVNYKHIKSIAAGIEKPLQALTVVLQIGLAKLEFDRISVLPAIRTFIQSQVFIDAYDHTVISEFYFKLVYANNGEDILQEKANIEHFLLEAIAQNDILSESFIQIAYDYTQYLLDRVPTNNVLQYILKHTNNCSSILLAKCLKLNGDVYYYQGNFGMAKEMVLQAKDKFENVEDQLGVAQCLQSLGTIARLQSNYEIAKTILQEAKDQFESIESQLGVAQCLQSLGDIAYIQSNYKAAKAMLQKAKHQFEDIGNQFGAARCLRSLGNIALMQDNYTTAETMLQDAKHQFKGIGNQLGVAQCLRSLGDIARMQSNNETAKTMLQQAKDQFEGIGYQLGAAQCLRSLSDIARMQSNYEAAKTMLQQAKYQFESIGNQLGAAQCLQSLGNIAYIQSNFEAAETILQQAKNQFESIGNQLGVSKCSELLEAISIM